jgi:hypothetical protein
MRIKKLQTTTQSSEGLNQILSKQGTKQFGLLYQLAPSLRHTGEKEFGLLPTLLKTPTTTETEGGVMEIRENVSAHYKLRDQIANLLPTPAATDIKGSGTNDTVRDRLDYSIEKNQDGQKTGMKLQPAFVEWMMGFPIGWTDLSHSATQ